MDIINSYLIMLNILNEANDNQPSNQILLKELTKDLEEAYNTRQEILDNSVIDLKALDDLDYDIHMIKESRVFLLNEFK